MTILPEKVREAWNERQAPAIFATVAADGLPNAIYVTCVSLFGDDRIVIADNYFNKTRANILAGSNGAVLFRAKDGRQYQIKGSLEYHTEGELFENMKTWNLPGKPGHAAAALCIEEIYSGAERIA